MKIFLSYIASIYEFNDIEKKTIQQLLTISNPLFNKKMEMNLSVFGIPQVLKYYSERDNKLLVPIGIIDEVIKLFPAAEIIDRRYANINTDYYDNKVLKTTLREYQNNVILSCSNENNGIIEAMTGSGKTLCFIALILQKKQNTLILVNTLELAYQTIQAITDHTNFSIDDIGFIGNGKLNIKPITVALHQSIKFISSDKLNDYFGMIIADEVHIVPAKTFAQNLNKLNAKFKYGFSATPRREDGLTPVIHFIMGSTIHKVQETLLTDVLIRPNYEVVKTNYDFPLFDSSEYGMMLTDLSKNENRNMLILETLESKYKDNYICLLCQRLEQVYYLYSKLEKDSVILTSEMSKKDRKKAMDLLRNKEKKYVISTFGLFSQGIDIPHLDTLFICAPIKSEIKIRQAAGRLMRISPGKTSATIVDFADIKIEMLKYGYYKRKKIYDKIRNSLS